MIPYLFIEFLGAIVNTQISYKCIVVLIQNQWVGGAGQPYAIGVARVWNIMIRKGGKSGRSLFMGGDYSKTRRNLENAGG